MAVVELVRRCAEHGLRAEASEPEHGTLGAGIRGSRLVPYQAVIGAREAGGDQVALRLRDGSRLDAMPTAVALSRIAAVVGAHSGDLWAPTPPDSTTPARGERGRACRPAPGRSAVRVGARSRPGRTARRCNKDLSVAL